MHVLFVCIFYSAVFGRSESRGEKVSKVLNLVGFGVLGYQKWKDMLVFIFILFIYLYNFR
jgi:phosphoglycerol transferase MdoB-like AlkP superfamily enzyme